MKLYGRNSVIERLKADPGSINKIYLQKRIQLSDVVKQVKMSGLTFESVEGGFLTSLCPDSNTQGVVAEVDEFRYLPFDTTLTSCLENNTVIFFVDGVTDPQNLGSMIRNIACLGGFSLVIPEHDSAQINSTVLKVASGGENYLPISKVPNIATAVRKIKKHGVWVSGADINGQVEVPSVRWRYPMAVVVGSEGKGIRPGILKELDESIRLPMRGAGLSYNVAVAAVLISYEISRTRERQ